MGLTFVLKNRWLQLAVVTERCVSGLTSVIAIFRWIFANNSRKKPIVLLCIPLGSILLLDLVTQFDSWTSWTMHLSLTRIYRSVNVEKLDSLMVVIFSHAKMTNRYGSTNSIRQNVLFSTNLRAIFSQWNAFAGCKTTLVLSPVEEMPSFTCGNFIQRQIKMIKANFNIIQSGLSSIKRINTVQLRCLDLLLKIVTSHRARVTSHQAIFSYTQQEVIKVFVKSKMLEVLVRNKLDTLKTLLTLKFFAAMVEECLLQVFLRLTDQVRSKFSAITVNNSLRKPLKCKLTASKLNVCDLITITASFSP